MTQDPSQQNLMPIGRFSASCRLSIKALRHYAEIGLLPPAYVDRFTGYRYYSREQARDAVLIGMLRSLDISIPVIRDLLHADQEPRDVLLRDENTKIETEIANKRTALQSIDRIRREGSLLPYSVEIRHEPQYVVAMNTITTNVESMLKDSANLVYSLFDVLREVDRQPLDPVMCINEDPNAKGEIVVHAGVGIVPPFPALKNTAIETIEAMPVAWCEHLGPYEELGLAYHAIFAWMQQYGHQQTSPMREIYRNDPADTPPELLRTEVMVPVEIGKY